MRIGWRRKTLDVYYESWMDYICPFLYDDLIVLCIFLSKIFLFRVLDFFVSCLFVLFVY